MIYGRRHVMYCKYYQLKEKPFQITTDPKFLWLGEKHKEALSILKYGILDNKWFLLLTGDVGTGKTTLINALLRSLDERVIVAAVPDPGLEELDLFNFIADAFHMDRIFSSKGEFLIHFKRFLNAAHDSHKKVLLIIDEAQQLTQQRLETIRLLSNIERQETKLINIFFVGQNEFNDILRRTENRALRQRITINYNIAPLAPAETAAYIAHRLKVAQAAKSMFTPEAVRRIAIHSGGYPRLINVLCDYALVTGYVKGIHQIGPDIISECARELKIPGRSPAPQQALPDAPAPTPRPQSGPSPSGRRPPASAPVPSAAAHAAVMPAKAGHPAWLWGLLGILLAAGVLLMGYYLGWRLPNQKAPMIAKAPAVRTPKTAATGEMQVSTQLPEVHPPVAAVPAAQRGAAATHLEGSQATGGGGRESGQTPSANRENPAGSTSAGRRAATSAEPAGSNAAAGMPGGQEISRNQPADSGGQRSAPPRAQSATPVGPVLHRDAALAVDTDLEKRIQELARRKKMVVYFGYDSNAMKDTTLRSLDTLSAFMQRYPRAEITIRGYTDSSGVYSYNQKLSEFRANMVKSYLVGKGTDPARIKTRGLGPANPVQSNQSEKTRRFNRRVEIEIFFTPRHKATAG